MWHKVASNLAEHFTVVATDLRGYGQSSKPPPRLDHANYSKRTMATDMDHVMNHLGFDRFAVLAHDRGARVAHRMAMDTPDAVRRMMLLDIAPTREMYANTDLKTAPCTAFQTMFGGGLRGAKKRALSGVDRLLMPVIILGSQRTPVPKGRALRFARKGSFSSPAWRRDRFQSSHQAD